MAIYPPIQKGNTMLALGQKPGKQMAIGLSPHYAAAIFAAAKAPPPATGAAPKISVSKVPK